jgi:hypothetical protein
MYADAKDGLRRDVLKKCEKKDSDLEYVKAWLTII